MAALNKIAPNSPSRQHPSELETSIANALYDLETNIPDMRSALRPLQFVSSREVSLPFARSYCYWIHGSLGEVYTRSALGRNLDANYMSTLY